MKIVPSAFVLLVGCFLFFCVPVSVRGADRALLIGIERYQVVTPTPGGEADAREMAQLLQARLGFPASSIKIILNEEATAKTIRTEFKTWLITGTRSGDRVFFLYAGHGSQLPDDNNEETDGFDETIVPYDAHPEGLNQIRDDEFEALIRQLSDRRGVFVFDSCHSGTISRGLPKLSKFPSGGGARYLPRPDQLPPLSRSGNDSYTVSSLPRSRKVMIADGFVTEPQAKSFSGTVIISAAQPDQTAFPVKLQNGRFRGALTYAIEQSLMTGEQLPVEKFRNQLVNQIADFQRSGDLPGDQVPVIEILGPQSLGKVMLFGSGSPEALAGGSPTSTSLTSPAKLTNPFSTETVSIQTTNGKLVYYKGETIRYQISTTMAGYLYLIVFSQQNVATVVFPNSEDPSNFISAGTQVFPPQATDPITVQHPFGQDIVVAIISVHPIQLGDQAKYTWQEIFSRLQLKEIQNALSRSLKHQPVWQAGSVVIETKP